MLNYSNWDQVSQERIEGAFIYSKGAPKGPAKPEAKEHLVTVDGIEFKLVYKIATKLSPIWRDFYKERSEAVYDPRVALDAAEQRRGFIDDSSGGYVDCPLAGAIPDGVPKLTPEQIETRLKVFITVANLCAQEDVAAKIAGTLQRKKNKMLYKGRVQPIAFLNLVDQRGWTYQLVAKNETDTQACIELRSKVPVTSELVGDFFGYPADLLSKTDIFF